MHARISIISCDGNINDILRSKSNVTVSRIFCHFYPKVAIFETDRKIWLRSDFVTNHKMCHFTIIVSKLYVTLIVRWRKESNFTINHKFCHFWVKVTTFIIGGKIWSWLDFATNNKIFNFRLKVTKFLIDNIIW